MIDRYSVHFIKLIVKTFHFGVYWPLLESTCVHCATLVALLSYKLVYGMSVFQKMLPCWIEGRNRREILSYETGRKIEIALCFKI